MAVPLIKAAVDAADFDKTVLPYVYQLYDLPARLTLVLQGHDSLLNFYTSTNPLIFGFGLSVFLAPIFLVAGEYNRNFSQVDRFWSILPTMYNAHYCLYAHLTGIPTDRVDLLFAASSIWSTRLTWNYWRRGGYQRGSEDYRWEELQKVFRGWFLWLLFDIIFIAFAQNVLLFIITIPSYALLLSSKVEPVGSLDYMFSATMVGFVAATFFADNAQQSFYNARDEYRKTKKVTPGYTADQLELGFNTTGLWSFSRHPNFAFEQSHWITLFLWAANVTRIQTIFTYIAIGPLAYLILFQASTAYTEYLTAGKYPRYKEWKKHSAMFVPGPLAIMSGGDGLPALPAEVSKKQK